MAPLKESAMEIILKQVSGNMLFTVDKEIMRLDLPLSYTGINQELLDLSQYIYRCISLF